MFCTGAAPTCPGSAPGSPARASPGRSVQATKSCQFSPAPASTIQASGVFAHQAAARRSRPSAPPRPRRASAPCCCRRPGSNFGAGAELRVVDDARARRLRCAARTSVRRHRRQPEAVERAQAGAAFASQSSVRRLATMAEFSLSFPLCQTPHHAQLRHRPRTRPGRMRNAVEQANKEIGTRFDFKGSGARVELADKGKERELTLLRRQRLPARPGARRAARPSSAKRGVDVRFLDLQRQAREDGRRQGQAGGAGQERHRQPRPAKKIQGADQAQQAQGAGRHPGRRGARHRRQARRPAGGHRAAAQGSHRPAAGASTTSAIDAPASRCASARRRCCWRWRACCRRTAQSVVLGRQHGRARRCWSSTASRTRWPSARALAGVTLLQLDDGAGAGRARWQRGHPAPGRRAVRWAWPARPRPARGAARSCSRPGSGGHFTARRQHQRPHGAASWSTPAPRWWR